MSQTTSLAPGVVVDGFRLTRLVAEGSMGSVYLAVDELLGRRLALKFLKGVAAVDAERFADEARTTARFNHPHIVTVYAAGVYGELPYIALEYVDGPTLRERMDAQREFAPAEAMRIARAIAEALAEAHALEIVHADLKPENVLLGRDGRLRVVDFGLSRLTGGEATAASGTPAYMAPERWSGSAPDPAIDVWALGVLLVEVLEGRRPWDVSELAQLAYAPAQPVFGPRVLASPCVALLTACLSTDAAARPTAARVVQTLDALLAGETPGDGRSPFRGLEAFSERDAADFHGREADVDAALEALRTVALLPVVGPSGVGKSSFVFAGLLPRLRESSEWELRVLRPGRKPWASLGAALGAAPESLAASPGALVARLRALAAGKRVLLVIDQFEELVTLSDGATRAAVLEAIALAASSDEPWRVVCTLRSDFLPEFASAPALAESLHSLFVLRPLTRAALQAAIEGPLRRVDHRADQPELPAKIAAELDGHANALPLLQFTCQELWLRRDVPRRLILEREYEVLGGAVGALASHAQQVVDELPSGERSLVRALLLRLVNLDGTRRPRTRAEVLAELPPEGASVLDRLLRERLLASSQAEEGRESLVELAHEALVSAWPRLQRWLADAHEALTLAQEIETSALAWDKRGRRADETWNGDALTEAHRRVEATGAVLSTRSREFLEAGRAREELRKRRRRRALAGGFFTVSLLALVFGVAALAFREKEREAVAQQSQIRLAAGDFGRFTLVLEPFDWDAGSLAATPARAPELRWTLHTLSKDGRSPAGDPVPADDVRRSNRRTVGDAVLEEVEAPARPVVFRFEGRGREGESCGPSWQVVRELPGYRERERPTEIHLKVPTCQATNADQQLIPAGPFFRATQPGEAVEVDLPAYRIDRTELPHELAALQYVSRRSGPPPRRAPEAMGGAAAGVPIAWVTASEAARLCWFLGRRLPTADEWQKAARGGRWLDAARTEENPLPRRQTPWGDADVRGVNVPPGGDRWLPVGTSPRDVSPYGVRDLGGNLAEWTSTDAPFPGYEGLRVKLGSCLTELEYTWGLDQVFVTDPDFKTFDIGVRCASL